MSEVGTIYFALPSPSERLAAKERQAAQHRPHLVMEPQVIVRAGSTQPELTNDDDDDDEAERRLSGIRVTTPIGAVLDERYRLFDRIGEGAIGIVYRAEDLGLKRLVAIKLIKRMLEDEPTAIERFKIEARSLAELRHDNIVQVYAFGRHSSSFYLAMEYVAGPNLDEVIEEHVARGELLDLDFALGILRHIASGLDLVHKQGIIHRDVKPGNVIIEAGTGRPVLIDFGLARRDTAVASAEQHGAASNGDASAAVKRSFAGTPAYISPESAGAGEVTFRSDIYALGCMAFEILTNASPFNGRDCLAVVRAHIEQEPPPVSSIQPDRASFDRVIARAMAKSPADRYDSCTAFIDDLEVALRKNRSHPPAVTKTMPTLPTMPTQPPISTTPPTAAITTTVPFREVVIVNNDPATHVNVLILERDEPLRQQLVRMLNRALDPLHLTATIDVVASQVALTTALVRSGADLVIVDEESLARPSSRPPAAAARQEKHDDDDDGHHRLHVLMTDARVASAEVIVLQRDFLEKPWRVAELGAHAAPKPINGRLITSLIGKLAMRALEKREQPQLQGDPREQSALAILA